MSGVNKVILIGRAGKDPEIRALASGGNVANISLATSDEWKDKETGEKKEKTEWHNVVVFGKLADIVASYVKKGSQIYVEGSLQTRKWTDQENIERYTTKVTLKGFDGKLVLLGSGGAGGSTTTSTAPAPAPAPAPRAAPAPAPRAAPAPSVADTDDTIPF